MEDMNLQQVLKHLGVCKYTFYTKVRPLLPPDYHVSPRKPRWRVASVEAFKNSQRKSP